MTRKQMKKFAEEIYNCELIHENPSSSLEEKSKAEKQIMKLTNQIMAMKDGISTMFEIDILVQELISKEIKGEN